MVHHPNEINQPYLRSLSSVVASIRNSNQHLYSFLRKQSQTDTGAENDGDKKTSSKNFEFQNFVREP